MASGTKMQPSLVSALSGEARNTARNGGNGPKRAKPAFRPKRSGGFELNVQRVFEFKCMARMDPILLCTHQYLNLRYRLLMGKTSGLLFFRNSKPRKT